MNAFYKISFVNLVYFNKMKQILGMIEKATLYSLQIKA